MTIYRLPGDLRTKGHPVVLCSEAANQIEAWQSIGERIKDGWQIISGHRWWRPGEDAEPVTAEQRGVLYPTEWRYPE